MSEDEARARVDAIPEADRGPAMLEWRRNMRELWASKNAPIIREVQPMYQELDRRVRAAVAAARKDLNATQG